MTKVVITGATSFIGQHLVRALSEANYSVVAVIHPNSQRLEMFKHSFPKAKLIVLGMQDYGRLSDEINEPVDAFVGLAWDGTRGKDRLDEVKQEKNYEYSLLALQSAITLGTKTFITAGSQAEYGIQCGNVTEVLEEKPITAYGKAKFKFYREAMRVCRLHNIRLIEPRIFSLYGVGDYNNSLIMSTIQKMKRNLPCDFTDCEQMWNFMNVRDAVEAIKFLLENKTIMSGVYNFAGEDTRKLKEYIFEIRDILDSKSELNFGVIPHNDSGRDGIQPDATKLLSTGWRPKVSFAQGIHEILVGI